MSNNAKIDVNRGARLYPANPATTGIIKRTGKGLPEWHLYKTLVASGRELGVHTPSGTFFRFRHGETFALIKEGNGRAPFVKLADGRTLSFDVWKDRQPEEIRRALDTIDPMYGDLYAQVLNDFPELDQFFKIHSSSKEGFSVLEYTGGFCRTTGAADAHCSIVVDISSEKHYDKLLQDRELSARAAAHLLGIDFEILKRHPEILARFVFLHEIGHAHDYLVNYVNNPRNGSDPNYDPARANKEVRTQEMNTLPYPGLDPVLIRKKWVSGELAKDFEQYRKYFQQKGIISPEELMKAQEKAYRDLPSETYADQFAARVLRKHWKTLGLENITALA